jgi:hypothetical protein
VESSSFSALIKSMNFYWSPFSPPPRNEQLEIAYGARMWPFVESSVRHPPGRHPPGRHPPGRHPPGRHPPGRHPPGALSGVETVQRRLQGQHSQNLIKCHKGLYLWSTIQLISCELQYPAFPHLDLEPLANMHGKVALEKVFALPRRGEDLLVSGVSLR